MLAGGMNNAVVRIDGGCLAEGRGESDLWCVGLFCAWKCSFGRRLVFLYQINL